MEITELEKQVLKQEYPQVSLSDDLDIERYFDLLQIKKFVIDFNSLQL